MPASLRKQQVKSSPYPVISAYFWKNLCFALRFLWEEHRVLLVTGVPSC